jgi:hypothetical protein
LFDSTQSVEKAKDDVGPVCYERPVLRQLHQVMNTIPNDK